MVLIGAEDDKLITGEVLDNSFFDRYSEWHI
jgi:hypothetical protein